MLSPKGLFASWRGPRVPTPSRALVEEGPRIARPQRDELALKWKVDTADEPPPT